MLYLEIAKVLKPQGIKGEIKVECFTSDLDFLLSLKSFNIDDVTYNITNIRVMGKFAYIKTAEICSMNEAELLRGKILKVEKPEEEMKENSFEFYITDLEDCKVEDENGNIVGFIDSVEKYGSADIINIKLGGGVRSFPFLKKIFKSIDVDNKKIVVYKNLLNEVLVWKLIF